MPILAAFLGTLFGGLVEFFVKYFSKSVALKLAFATLMVGGVTAAVAVLEGLVTALQVSMPPDLAQAFATILPSNTQACLSAVLATEAVCSGLRLYLLGMGR